MAWRRPGRPAGVATGSPSGFVLSAPMVAALASAAVVALSPKIFNDGDTWMHIAAGDLMLRLGRALHADPFSYTFLGKPWQTHEWLAEVVMALAYRAGGWPGESLLFAVAAGATAGLLARHVGRWLSGAPLAVVLCLGLTCLAPSMLARPHVLALPCLEMWTAELVMARHGHRAPRWLRLAAIMAVWANLHGSFIFGLGLLAAFGLEAAWRDRRDGVRALLPWAWLGPLLVAVAMVSPHGLDNLLFPARLGRMTTLGGIDEWAPVDFDRNPAFEASLLAMIFVLGWKGVRVPVFALLLLLALAHLGLRHARHVQLFAILAPLLLAEPLGAALGGSTGSPVRKPWSATVAVVLAGGLAVARIALGYGPGENGSAPAAALAHVPPGLRSRPVFNAYRFGGFLIFNGVKPYIDSRAEVYGDTFRTAFLALQGGDSCAFASEAARRGFAWTILDPESPLLPVLDHASGWRRLYADRYAVVHVHDGDVWDRPASTCPLAAPSGRP